MEFNRFSLNHAWEEVSHGSKVAGIDGITTEGFAYIVEEELNKLQRQLNKETYRALPAKGFYLQKKSGGQRLIGISTVRDRVVQRLILQTLYPVVEEVFADCSYAYRPGLGVKKAIAHVSEFYSSKPCWVVKADISQFFDNICWPLLFTEVEKLGIGERISGLIEQQVKSGIILKGKPVVKNQGVIQGSGLSGILTNLYLTDFDHQCMASGLNLVRYGDDFVVITEGLLPATRILHEIEGLLGCIDLKLQPEKTRIIAPYEEFTFLGHEFKAGQIIAPVKKAPKPSQQQTRVIVGIGEKPAVCSIVKNKITAVKHKPEHYWSDSMTTLYVTDQGAYINVKNQQFQVVLHGELRCQVPVNRVSHLVLFGCCNMSHGATSLALQRRIPVMFLSHRGRYFGRLETEGMASVEYLSKQVMFGNQPEFKLAQAKSIVEGKLNNSRVLLQRLNRRKSQAERKPETEKGIADLAVLMDKITTVESIEVLLGYEGQGAHVYFQALANLFKGPFAFEKRTRRPPTDPINSLMSLGYTLLHQNIYSLVQAIGLHTHFGNLHVPRDNHPALVSDLVEEFRAPVVDSLIAYLVNSSIFNAEDFTPPDQRGGVYLHPDALKKFLKHWEEKLQTETTHPHTGYKVNYRRCFELQVWEYVSCLTGKQPIYRPMKVTK